MVHPLPEEKKKALREILACEHLTEVLREISKVWTEAAAAQRTSGNIGAAGLYSFFYIRIDRCVEDIEEELKRQGCW